MIKRILAIILAGAFPIAVGADLIVPGYVYSGPTGIGGLFTWSRNILSMVLPLIIAISIVWFVYNVFQYMIASNEEGETKAKMDMVWGIVAIFVMVSVWGLVNVLGSTFKLTNSVINAPGIQTSISGSK